MLQTSAKELKSAKCLKICIQYLKYTSSRSYEVREGSQQQHVQEFGMNIIGTNTNKILWNVYWVNS